MRSFRLAAIGAALLSAAIVVPASAAEPEPPSYERLPFEIAGIAIHPLEGSVLVTAAEDAAALRVLSDDDLGGFHRARPVALANRTQPGASDSPNPAATRSSKARPLVGSTATAEVPSLAPLVTKRVTSFGVVPGDRVSTAPPPDFTAIPSPPNPQPPSTTPAAGPASPTATSQGATPTGVTTGSIMVPPVTAVATPPVPAVAVTASSAVPPFPLIVIPRETPVSPPTPAPTIAPLPPSSPSPTPTPTPSNGAVVITTDREGLPILSRHNMKPGDFAFGTVTLTNAGRIVFLFSLDVQAGSGPLWEDPKNGLQLEVRRVVDNLVLYTGPLAASTGPLGQLRPSEKVLLALRVTLPESAGNSFQLTAVSVDFVWKAVGPIP